MTSVVVADAAGRHRGHFASLGSRESLRRNLKPMRNRPGNTRRRALSCLATWGACAAVCCELRAGGAGAPARAGRPEGSPIVGVAGLCAGRGNWPAVVALLRPRREHLPPQGVLLLAEAYGRLGGAAAREALLEQTVQRWPTEEACWLAWIRQALDRQQYATALARVAQAERHIAPTARLDYLAARACYALDRIAGPPCRVRVPGGRPGQFTGQGLLVEERGDGSWLCCPRDSALFRIRRAIDQGLDDPQAVLLYARIWEKAGRPQMALGVLRARENLLLEAAGPAELEIMADLALAGGDLRRFLRYSRLRAAALPAQRPAILFDCYRRLARECNVRGEPVLHLEFLRRAVELNPAHGTLLVELGDAAWNLGRRDQARRCYEEALGRTLPAAERSRITQRLSESLP